MNKTNIKQILLFFLLFFQQNIILACCNYTSTQTLNISIPTGIAFSPSGNCLAISDLSTNTVNIYAFDQTTCTVNPTSIATLTSSDGISSPSIVKFSANGTCLIVVNNGAAPIIPATVTVYQINSINCQITNTTPTSTISIFGIPTSIAISPNGTCFAIAIAAGAFSAIQTYSLDANCNTILIDSLGSSNEVSDPQDIAFSTDGSCIAILSNNNNTNIENLSVWELDSSCNFITPATSTINFPAGEGLSVAFSPISNCIAYSRSGSGMITPIVAVHQFNQAGLCTVTVPAETTFTSSDISPSIAFSPTGDCFAIANAGTPGVTAIYSVNSDCSINTTAQATLTSPGTGDPVAIAFSPSSDCIAVANQGNVVIYKKALSINVTITSSSQTICNSMPITLTANVTNGVMPFSYQWFMDGNPVGPDSATLNVTSPGNYRVTVTDANGCSSNSSDITIVADNIAVGITPNNPNTCPNSNLTANITGGVGPFIFDWTLNGATISTSQTATVTTSGNYNVTVTDSLGCSANNSLNITVSDIAVTISAVDSCQANTTLTANITGGINPFSFQWFLNNTLIAGATSAVLNTSQVGTYSVSVTDANNCIVNNSINIGNIEVTVTSTNLDSCTAALTANITSGNAPFLIQWFLNGQLINNANTENLTVTTSGNYTVTVTDADNCSASASLEISLTNCCIKPDANDLSISICQKYRN